MGKIRVKTIGVAELEETEKTKAKTRQEAKKAKSASRRTVKGAHGGERLVSMAPTEKELAQIEVSPITETPQKEEKRGTRPPRRRSQRYLTLKKLVDPNRLYPAEEAIKLVKKTSKTRFNGTIEVHLNTQEKGIRGTVTLPHGVGKPVRVAIADEKLISEIEQGKINFDILVAHPEMMPKLAKVGKILGPRGLMPNPKDGTITNDPQKLTLNVAKGEIQFKTEPQAPLIHQVIGKADFTEKTLLENLRALVLAVGKNKIRQVTLSSTMGPGIKVDFNSLS